MEKTILYTEKDGYKIITGFDSPVMDAVATNLIVDDIIKETAEWKAVESKKAEYGAATKSMHKAARDKNEAAYSEALVTMTNIQNELKPMACNLAEKIVTLRLENAVYFTPRKGEVIMDASEADKLSQAVHGRAQGTLITLDGSVIENNRDKVYFRKASGKWVKTVIDRIGDQVPADAVLEADVTVDQRDAIEVDRVGVLSHDARRKEKEQVMGFLMKRAGDMRSGLEIQADPDALTKSQDWYKIELTRINTLYK